MSTASETTFTPAILRGQWFEGRFVYWRGQSGRRYLFSAVAADDLTSFDNAVVLIPRDNDADDDRLFAMDDSARQAISVNGRAFVHLLAKNPGERRDVIADLTTTAA